jgi:hypothetical protein
LMSIRHFHLDKLACALASQGTSERRVLRIQKSKTIKRVTILKYMQVWCSLSRGYELRGRQIDGKG